MISLTETAAGKVRELLEQEGRFDIALRVAVQPGGCSGLRYAMYLDDEVSTSDIAAEQFGVRLVIDRMSEPYLKEATIDFVDTLEQSGLTIEKDRVVFPCAGDSGDGMQLTGDRFTTATAMVGNDLATLPDFPAEIRAPAGTLAGVSAFQIHFSSHDILTPGDAPNVLVAMNPAALKANLTELERGATIILNEDAFTKRNLEKAGYESNPLED